ncbi:hypothetical protein [Streptomyces sp. NPDC005017]|uniref:hypothetical protein n=1 Tax=Streptomyces sp. NPDC005017 TaxID=3364706 RepID=UPI00368112C4
MGDVLKVLPRTGVPSDDAAPCLTACDLEGSATGLATSKGKKTWFGLAALAVVLLLLLLGSCDDDCEDEEGTTPGAAMPRVTVTATATAAPRPVGSQVGEAVDDVLERVAQTGLSVGVHDASDQDEKPSDDWTVCFEKATLSKVEFAAVPPKAPCPSADGRRIPWPKMPDVKGIAYGKAVQMLADGAGGVVLETAYQDEVAYDQDNESGDYADWRVCFQSIAAGRSLTYEPEVILHAVQEGEACPSVKGLYKDPTNDPAYVEPVPGSDYDPDAGSSGDGGSSDGGSGSDNDDYSPGEKGGCPPGGCYNPCPPGGCR